MPECLRRDVMERYAVPQAPIELDNAPLVLYRTAVHDDWIDYNAHMNEAFAVFLVGYGCDALARGVGAMPRGALYTVETHVSYLREVPRGADVSLTGRILAVWPKRWQVLYTLFLEKCATPAVSIEQISVYTKNGQASIFPEQSLLALQRLCASHCTLPPTPLAGRRVGDAPARL